jgi:hypothetical protein
MREILDAIGDVRWPPGGRDFAIYPESGKKRGQGSGVRPIRDAFVTAVEQRGWTGEVAFPLEGIEGGASFGPMDAAKTFGSAPPFMVEWETGNISSSGQDVQYRLEGVARSLDVGGPGATSGGAESR